MKPLTRVSILFDYFESERSNLVIRCDAFGGSLMVFDFSLFILFPFLFFVFILKDTLSSFLCFVFTIFFYKKKLTDM